MTYIKSKKNKECNNSICRIFKKIDIDKINAFIDEITDMSDVRKKFYKKGLKLRYDIVQEVYNELNNF